MAVDRCVIDAADPRSARPSRSASGRARSGADASGSASRSWSPRRSTFGAATCARARLARPRRPGWGRPHPCHRDLVEAVSGLDASGRRRPSAGSSTRSTGPVRGRAAPLDAPRPPAQLRRSSSRRRSSRPRRGRPAPAVRIARPGPAAQPGETPRPTTPSVTMPPPTTLGHHPEDRRRDAALERAQLVGRADEHEVDRRDPAAHRLRRLDAQDDRSG